uniref:General transcription factor IIH subunit 4 n=1 Tax=Globodera pallida TaxID=36090 RepID=A0A183CD12_GLOPA
MADTEFGKRPLLTYLASLNDELVQQLFESRPCVIAIFRLLPAFAQQSVLQLIDWRSWTRKRFHLSMSNSLQLLFRLRILEGDFDGDFQINVDFRMNYVSSLLANPMELSDFKFYSLEEKSRAASKDLMGKSMVPPFSLIRWFLLTPLMAQLSAVASVEEDKAGENGGAVLRNSPATNSPATAGGKGTGGDGFLIVETNYRVFAYTNSTLQLAILSTFTQILYRFQDIAIGVLSRDSIRRALQTGITARQITQYLTANMRQLHARNSSRASDPMVPVTVVEQIYLWEQERKRFTSDNGTLYSNYDSEADFVAMRDFAREAGLSLWDCSVSKMVIVKADGDERVKRWWKEFRERGGQ